MQQPTIINAGIAIDDRGSLRFCNEFNFVERGVKRFYQVENHRAGFIRAWHGHEKEAKYVYVASGCILFGCFPLEGAPPPSNIVPKKYVLNAQKPSILYVPAGYYNGFKCLSPNTKILFFSTSTLEESKNDDIRLDYNFIPDFWNEDFR